MVGFIGKIGKAGFVSFDNNESPPSPTPVGVTFYDHSVEIGMPLADDTGGYSMGNAYEVAKAGYTDRVFFYKPEGATQSFRRCGFYDPAGNLLAQGSRGEMSPEPDGPAWIPISLDQPLVFDASDRLIPAVTVNTGYASEAGAFAEAEVRGDITAIASGDIANGNGRFDDTSGTVLNFPDASFNSASYFTDGLYFFDQTPPSGIIAGFPNAGTTGIQGSLTAYAGPMTITTDDLLIENQEISGKLTIQADRVTVRNCRITYTDDYGIDGEGGIDLTVDRCTIVGPGLAGAANGGILGQGTFTGNDISQSENGIVVRLGQSSIEDNYIHDLRTNAAVPHYDGISLQGGQTAGTLIQHNTVISSDTSCIFLKDDFDPITGVTINNNLCLPDEDLGPPGYPIVIDQVTSITGITVTNNKLVRGGFGYYSADIEATLSGNVNAYSGIPV